MSIKIIGCKLLEVHRLLFKKLESIPKARRINYRVDIKDGKHIGKPRFDPKHYSWSVELKVELRDHLQQLFFFFKDFSYWNDEKLTQLLDGNERNASNKSILFLLENDTYSTDEVYGDYLIEKVKGRTIVSYFRRNEKRKSFELETIDDPQIKEWIEMDIVQQISLQFSLIWELFETEIEVCIDEDFHKIPSLKVPDIEKSHIQNRIIQEFEQLGKILEINPTMSLLQLGRLIEHWYRILLYPEKLTNSASLFRAAYSIYSINKKQRKLLNQIRTNYNYLKHDPRYNISQTEILMFYEKVKFIFVM